MDEKRKEEEACELTPEEIDDKSAKRNRSTGTTDRRP